VTHQLTVGFLPWWPANPYQILLKRELNRMGVRVIGNPELSLLRLLVGRDGLDVVHVHWPHGLYKTFWQMLHALVVLVAYRLIKNNVVWTVHELDAYESKHPGRDAWFRSVVMRLSRRLIVHGEHTRRELVAAHGYRRPVDVAHHPSYIGWYKDEVSQPQARLKLGLPATARVYLYFGYIKPYKGVEDLIQAFRSLKDDHALLLIAGRPLDDEIKQNIESLAAADPRIHTFLRYLPDDDIQYFFRAADIAVFPFKQTQTSGSLMLAMSFGRPIIAPSVATLPEYVDNSSGILFDPGKPGDLARAVHEADQRPLAALGLAARQRAESLSWADMAKTHLAAYQR
jgi:glycosyltransferase involved in cell wall biosynthesis